MIDMPDMVDLLGFFESDPVFNGMELSDGNEGVLVYEKTDSRGVRLRVEFQVYSDWIAVDVQIGGETIYSVNYDGADRVRIEKGKLLALFSRGSEATLTVEVSPQTNVKWYTQLRES